MADLRSSVRDLFLQGVKAVNSAANNVATATKSKVEELNLSNRRKELMEQLAIQIYEAWQQGLELPESLNAMLTEVHALDAQLAAYIKKDEPDSPPSEEESTPNQEEHAEASMPTIVVPEDPEPGIEPETKVESVPTLQQEEETCQPQTSTWPEQK